MVDRNKVGWPKFRRDFAGGSQNPKMTVMRFTDLDKKKHIPATKTKHRYVFHEFLNKHFFAVCVL